jgi:hypothetical protein
MPHRWGSVCAIICISITLIAIHTFAAKSYSSPCLLGMATGGGLMAALWLARGLARRNSR